MSDSPNQQDLQARLAHACAALPLDDPARAVFESVAQLLATTSSGPIVAGPLSSARDTNIATNQTIHTTTIVVPPTNAPRDHYATNLAWLERLVAHYGAVPDDIPQDASINLDDLRLRLARGVRLWPAVDPPARMDDLTARSRVALLLWPLIAAPLTGNPRYVLPLNWLDAAAALLSPALASELVALQQLYHQREAEVLFQRLLAVLVKPQHAAAIRRLLTDLRDPARGAQALAADRLAQTIADGWLPPAVVVQATPLRLLAVGLGGALLGAGALAAAELTAGQGDALLHLVQQLARQLRPSPAQAAERPAVEAVAPNIVHTPSGALSIPITPAQWRAELARRDEVFGQHGLRQSLISYWCYVRAGTYTIGGWEKGEPSARITLPAFWIARVPITVAQYRVFIEAGGYHERRWWTPHGWAWRFQNKSEQPSGWGDAGYSRVSQPVIGVSWYAAMAYCSWLNDQLPAGSNVRLPTEAEWEAAAAYDAQWQRHTYPWGEAVLTPERAVYDQHSLPTLVPKLPDIGTRLTGGAASGALDLVGTVYEWFSSSYEGYPGHSATREKDFVNDSTSVSGRGGSYFSYNTSVSCVSRTELYTWFDLHFSGFRIVVAARSH